MSLLPDCYSVGLGAEYYRDALLCPWLKKVFGDEVDCLSPAVGLYHPILPKRRMVLTNMIKW